MRNSRLDRILYIQQVLVQGGVLNKQQTADRFGVSEKTIQRDLDTLRNYFADSEPRREILYNSAKGLSVGRYPLPLPHQQRDSGGMQDFAGKPLHGQGGNVPHSGQAGAGVHPAG